MSDTPGRSAGQRSPLAVASPIAPAVPYPLSAFERRAAHPSASPSTHPAGRPRAAKGYGALVLPWHSSPRHEVDQSALHAATHGALALIEEIDESQVFPSPRPLDTRHTILLAEDDPRLARVVQSALELEGEAQWSVTVANDGARALELAAASPPQVMLLDVFLPGVDGVEVYKRLRADPATRATRVIFVSAATSLDLYERGIQDGVLLRKPFDLYDLVGLVRALLTV